MVHRMKVPLILLLPALTLANPQFFQGIGNAFNSLFGGSSNQQQPPRQQPFRRPPPQQQFQQQQQGFQRPSQGFQQPQQGFQQQQQGFQQPSQGFQQQTQQQIQPQQPQFRPPQQQFRPQPVRQSQPTFQQNSFSAPAAPQFTPEPFRPQQSQQLRLQASPDLSVNTYSVANCTGPRAPNYPANNPKYVVTWKFGCTTFTQENAKLYCQGMNMVPVSLDTIAKQDEFNRLIAQDAQRYFWTGGIVDHANKEVGWENPAANTISFSQSAHWSSTGGAGLPQPDNRAAGDNPPHPEVCLGILNNFYADGIKWHDVACHHKKPTVCEPKGK